MLKTLHLQDFTVFADVHLAFSPGLNVIVGQNGTGKTHLLKAAYLLNRAWPDLMFKRSALNRKRAEAYFEERLLGLFQPVRLANLIRHGSPGGCRIAGEVEAFIPTVLVLTEAERQQRLAQFPFGSHTETMNWALSIDAGKELALVDTNARLDADVVPDTAAVNAYVPKSLFIPSKEIVSFYEGLIALLDRYEIKLDATYGDLARAMNGPELAVVPLLASGLLHALEQRLDGQLSLENGRLVFAGSDGRQTEGPLMAEGLRKLATLLFLIRRGCISEKGETLFWDEPETNLNPAFIRQVAEVLMWLTCEGVQVIVATHSLFLLREFEILLANAATTCPSARFFGLQIVDARVVLEQGDHIDDIGDITALDESLKQSDRYLAMGN